MRWTVRATTGSGPGHLPNQRCGEVREIMLGVVVVQVQAEDGVGLGMRREASVCHGCGHYMDA